MKKIFVALFERVRICYLVIYCYKYMTPVGVSAGIESLVIINMLSYIALTYNNIHFC